MDLVIFDDLTIPGDELDFVFSRASGPGGQHVNKVETRVQLRFRLFASRVLDDAQKDRIAKAAGRRLTADGEVLMTCGRHRERSRNRDEVRERLRAFIVEVLTPQKTRRETKPTRAAKKRRLDAKQRRGAIKQDRRRPDRGD